MALVRIRMSFVFMLGPKATKNCLENLATNENGNWSSFQLANRAPPLGVTGSPIAPSARIIRIDTHFPLVDTTSTRTYAWEHEQSHKKKLHGRVDPFWAAQVDIWMFFV